MSKIVTYVDNLLEDGTVTVSPAADSSYPAYRLYDRHIGRSFKFGSVVNPSTIKIDQGATGSTEIDTIIIPNGHNLDGLTLTLEYSENNSDWTQADQWSQSGTGNIQRTFTAATKRYWRLSVASPSSAPSLYELFLTKSYTWERNPEELDRINFPEFNVVRVQDAGGRPRFIELGEAREYREYSLYKISGDHRTAIVALNNSWAGKNPFWMKDVDGSLIYGELVSKLQFSLSGDFADTDFKFLEVPQ